MSKFFFYGLVCSLLIGLVISTTVIAILKVDSICDVSCVDKHFGEAPPFLKIKKIGIHKQIASPEQTFFNCQVDKACMEVCLADKNVTCKELLSQLSGRIRMQDGDKHMVFHGSGGMLNYQDCSLNVYDCRFHVTPLPEDQADHVASGGMKVLFLSLKP